MDILILVIALLVAVFASLITFELVEKLSKQTLGVHKSKMLGQLSFSRAIDVIRNLGFSGKDTEQISAQVPDMVDVVALALHGGVPFDRALEHYILSYEDTELAQRLRVALQSWRMGVESREESLLKLSASSNSEGLKRFVGVVLQALQVGAPSAEQLFKLAQELRSDYSVHVEEQIEKAPVKMVLPMTGLILPSLLLAIVGPLFGSYL